MNYSFQDIYPMSPSNQLPTPEQTIPLADNEMEFAGIVDTSESTGATVTDNADGMKKTGDSKQLIYGALLLMFSVLVILHFTN